MTLLITFSLPISTTTISNLSILLSYFLSIDYFCTFSTGSEHGQILLDILREKGDTLFFKALTLLNQSEKINVKGYILIGIDNQKKYNIYLIFTI